MRNNNLNINHSNYFTKGSVFYYLNNLFFNNKKITATFMIDRMNVISNINIFSIPVFDFHRYTHYKYFMNKLKNT